MVTDVQAEKQLAAAIVLAGIRDLRSVNPQAKAEARHWVCQLDGDFDFFCFCLGYDGLQVRERLYQKGYFNGGVRDRLGYLFRHPETRVDAREAKDILKKHRVLVLHTREKIFETRTHHVSAGDHQTLSV